MYQNKRSQESRLVARVLVIPARNSFTSNNPLNDV